ncbi:MAG TPA: hypothetical protein VLF93_04415 [Candidatus Saccharimonadales bacterium]|nr:hypothetical protein [Candidatus Saccharimonadales bacterium]
MRKIHIQARSSIHSHKDLWKIMTAIEDYPTWCKFCKKMLTKDIKVVEGTVFHDVTTLLWIPLTIKHVITKVKPHEELHFFLPLPGGGKMWHKFTFKQKGKYSYMTSEIIFDLGSRLRNATVGRILEKRWRQLIEEGFPGFDEKKRIQ